MFKNGRIISLWVIALSYLLLFLVLLFWEQSLGRLLLRDSGDIIIKAIERLVVLGAIAIPLERATQVFLRLTDQNGPERIERTRVGVEGTKDATIPAHLFVLIVGIGLALSGISFLGALLADTTPLSNLNAWQLRLFQASDVVITAGLLAGGASVLHEAIEQLKLLYFSGESSKNQVRAGAISTFTLTRDDTNGILFAGPEKVEATVPPSDRLPEGTYKRCIVRHLRSTETEDEIDDVWTIILPVSLGGLQPVKVAAEVDVNDPEGTILISREDFEKIVRKNKLLGGGYVDLEIKD